MITVTVTRNGRRICIAGVPGDGFLSANLFSNPKDQSGVPLSLVVGGLESKPGQPGTYSDWCRERLEVGDEISIRIAESDERDDPVEERMDPPKEIVLQEKKK